MHITVQVTRIGRVGIAEENGLITNLFFEGELPVPEPRSEASPLTNEAFRQLAAYLRGELKTFSFPMAPSSTPFSTQVRKALLRGSLWHHSYLCRHCRFHRIPVSITGGWQGLQPEPAAYFYSLPQGGSVQRSARGLSGRNGG